MPKTKFQEFIFTFITSGCMIFIMGVYNVARTSGCYLQTRTAFFPIGMVHRASLCILHCQQNVQILRIPRGKINWPTNLHHPLHPDLHSLYNGAASYSVTCSLPPTKEMNLNVNSKQYEGKYRSAMYAAVKAANPNWQPGQPFDSSILDSVTRELVESNLVQSGNQFVRKSIDYSV